MTPINFYIEDSETKEILFHISDFEYAFLPNKGEDILVNDNFYTVTDIVKSYRNYDNSIDVTVYVEESIC